MPLKTKSRCENTGLKKDDLSVLDRCVIMTDFVILATDL